MDFLNNFVSTIINTISQFGYLGIGLAVTLEYACFPLPSEAVLPFIGILASKSTFGFLNSILVSILAGILGSIICYSIGYFGGNSLINWTITKFPKTQTSIDKLNIFFDKYGKFAVCIARIFPLTRTYVSLLAGSLKLNVVTFLIYSFLGITVWNTLLISSGYFLGENWVILQSMLKKYAFIFICVLILMMVSILFYKKFIRKKVR